MWVSLFESGGVHVVLMWTITSDQELITHQIFQPLQSTASPL